MTKTTYLILSAIIACMFTACIEDSVSVSASDQPEFSTDTLSLGDVLTEEPTPTGRFIVHNRHGKIINIDNISLRNNDKKIFRLNVDGISGDNFNNIEIRPNDSIFVFVEATLPENGVDTPVEVESQLDFTTRGVTQTVILSARGQDVTRLKGLTINTDTNFTSDKPYQIYDSLVVAEGTTLTLEAGTRLLFHDKNSLLRVYGTLKSLGTPQKNVNMTGDRTGYVAAKIPYEIMSGQWDGVFFMPSSGNNELNFTSIRNTVNGVNVDHAKGNPALKIVGSQLRNSQGYALASYMSDLFIAATELADASAGVVYLEGGNHIINHCTIANYYLFSALGGAALQFAHLDADSDNGSEMPYLTADISNSIIYGNGKELSHGDLEGTGVMLRRVLLGVAGSDDSNFIECLWESDPKYYTVRADYFFDYRLKDESDAIGKAYPALMLPESKTDRYGMVQNSSAPDLGAYVYVPESKN